MSTITQVVLEPAAQELADATANAPYPVDLGPSAGRNVVDEVQSGEIEKPDVEIQDTAIPGGPAGVVSIRMLRPWDATEALPVILYTHGAGWVFGNHLTHDRLIRELAVGSGAAVVFPNYSLSPEAKYPTAIEECYAVLQWIAEEGTQKGLNASRLAVAGDSVGGNMSIAVSLMSKDRRGPHIQSLLLFYPVTHASFDTDSYHEFAEGSSCGVMR